MQFPMTITHTSINDQLRLEPNNSDDGELLYDSPGDLDQMTERCRELIAADGLTWDANGVTLRDMNSLPSAIALFKSISDAYNSSDTSVVDGAAEAYQLANDDDFDYSGGIPWMICEAIEALVGPIDPPNDEA